MGKISKKELDAAWDAETAARADSAATFAKATLFSCADTDARAAARSAAVAARAAARSAAAVAAWAADADVGTRVSAARVYTLFAHAGIDAWADRFAKAAMAVAAKAEADVWADRFAKAARAVAARADADAWADAWADERSRQVVIIKKVLQKK